MVSKAIDVTKRSWDTPRAEELHETVSALLVVVMKIPKHARIRHSSLWVALVGSIQRRKLGGITDEEDR
jgi:hypothetical protein